MLVLQGSRLGQLPHQETKGIARRIDTSCHVVKALSRRIGGIEPPRLLLAYLLPQTAHQRKRFGVCALAGFKNVIVCQRRLPGFAEEVQGTLEDFVQRWTVVGDESIYRGRQ